MAVTLKFQFTPEQLTAVTAVQASANASGIAGWFVYFGVPIVIVDLFAFGVNVGGHTAVAFIVFAMTMLFVAPKLWHRGLMRDLKKVGELEYVFSNEHVTFRDDRMTATIQWSSWIRSRETKDFFILYRNSFDMIAIPKTAFSSEEQMSEFRVLLENIRQAVTFTAKK